MKILGLDIGTTTICAAVIDCESGAVAQSKTVPNSFNIIGRSFESKQSPDGILSVCVELVDSFLSEYADISSIGITGQMHGVLYLDSDGNAVSDLHTWQDASADTAAPCGKTYAALLSELTGYQMATGFGCSTMFYKKETGEAPANAVCVSTIHDYVGMKLGGLTRPVMHTSDAASFGLFDKSGLCFDSDAFEKAGLDFSLMPEVVSGAQVIGRYKNIPVAVAIGDNQSSFIGSVSDTDSSILVNFGTGSQISFTTRDISDIPSTEARPCHGKDFIRVGSALCGGRAFAALENFIRHTINLSGADIPSAYRFIDAYLEQNEEPENALAVDTRFSGTRENPSLRGSVSGISTDNFTPGHLIYGVLHGMTDELFNMYKACGASAHTRVVGSGNGLRKNSALQKIVSETFGMELLIPAHREEAAFGAALYGGTAAGLFTSLGEAQKLIKYE